MYNLSIVEKSSIDICFKAHSLRHCAFFHNLTSFSTSELVDKSFTQVRHCIGRLDSWSRASKCLVNTMQASPGLLQNWRVETIKTPKPQPNPLTDIKTTLKVALAQMIPDLDIDRFLDLVQSVPDGQSKELAPTFQSICRHRNFQPIVHAELLMMEHFYIRNLQFANEERYIACSNPSCYCCDLYTRLHPGDFVPRSCHGNVWISWHLPPRSTIQQQAASDQLWLQLTPHIRQDVLAVVMSRAGGGKRLPDSTTGPSLSVRADTSRGV